MILYKVIHHLEKQAEHDLAPVPTADKEDRSENDDMELELNGSTRETLPLRPDKPNSGENLSTYLDEEPGRFSDHQDGIEMRRANPLRVRSSDPNGSGSHREMPVVV